MKCEQRRRHESVPDVRDCVIVTFFSIIIFPLGLWWGRLFSVSPWGYAWHWGRIHTKRRWSLLTTQPSQGWVRGLWRSLGRPPLWLSEPCSPPGLYNAAPAREKQDVIHWILNLSSRNVKHVVEELTCPKWALAASKPPTCSLFLKRSKGYVIVLLMIPAPLPQTRLLRFPWRGT